MLVLAGSKAERELVYNTILDGIVNLKIKPGTTLDVKKIAHELQVSEISVREAFVKMQETKAIIEIAEGQTIVTLAPPEWLMDIFSIRSGLESTAVYTSIPFLTIEDIDNIIKIDFDLQQAYAKEDKIEYATLARKFHNALVEKCPHKDLYNEIVKAARQCRYGRIRFAIKPGALTNSDREHELIINAIKKRDQREAAELTREHFLRISQEIGEVMRISEKIFCEKVLTKRSFL